MTEVTATSFENALDQVLAVENSLTDEQRSQLSKVLFPDTHTQKVSLCGKVRDLRPLPIKYSRKVNSELMPFNDKVKTAAQNDLPFEIDQDIVNALCSVAKILSEFYAWEDVLKKIDDEDVLLDELQSLAIEQQAIQGDNDFLLGPLRVLIKLMQTREILQRRVITLGKSSSSTPPS